MRIGGFGALLCLGFVCLFVFWGFFCLHFVDVGFLDKTAHRLDNT